MVDDLMLGGRVHYPDHIEDRAQVLDPLLQFCRTQAVFHCFVSLYHHETSFLGGVYCYIFYL